MDKQFFMNNLWLWKEGLPEHKLHNHSVRDLEQLRKTEWSKEFENLMRSRLLFGAIRYGRMGHGGPVIGKPNYDRRKSIRKRLKFFEETGNAEWLVDIANMALLMYEERQHANWNFAHEDDIYHDEIIQ